MEGSTSLHIGGFTTVLEQHSALAQEVGSVHAAPTHVDVQWSHQCAERSRREAATLRSPRLINHEVLWVSLKNKL